jgi:antitoxin (DNA-binding transcriptional repressor) of toxin-antitoxin stability system
MDHDKPTITVDDATHQFSDLLTRVEKKGEEIAIVRDGNVVARIIPGRKKITTLGDLRRAWAKGPRLSQEEADAWLKEIDELRGMSPMPPSAWD